MPVASLRGFKKVNLTGGFGFYFVFAISYGKVLAQSIENTDVAARAMAKLYGKQYKKSVVKVFAFGNLLEMKDI